MTRSVNQDDLRPTRNRKSSPVVCTEPAVPVSVMASARPPHSPLPSRVSTAIEVSVPMAG